jgi:hypothetical protein
MSRNTLTARSESLNSRTKRDGNVTGERLLLKATELQVVYN